MNFNEYQEAAKKTALYPEKQGVAYTALGLAGEAGEVANKVKKFLRGDFDSENWRIHYDAMEEYVDNIASELGDVLWYVAMVAEEHGLSLELIAINNINKLAKRAENNTLKGSGDNR